VVGAEQQMIAKTKRGRWRTAISTTVMSGSTGLCHELDGAGGADAKGDGGFRAAALFTNQTPPTKPRLDLQAAAYLQAFADISKNTPKYIKLATNTEGCVVFDLQRCHPRR